MTGHAPASGEDFDATPKARQELFIGLVGAMGTNLDAAADILRELLNAYDYSTEPIRISDLIRRIPEYASLDRRHAYEYYRRMIEGGNLVCQELGDKGALAEMAVQRVSVTRVEKRTEQRRAFVFVSLKRPDEVRRLREIYGGLFYAIAIFADAGTREDRMTRQINADVGRADDPEGRYEAQRLIRTDEREDKEWGQKVSDTFALADYFVRSDDQTELRSALSRFLTLVFGKPYVSPTRGEVAMMHALSEGLRSADLSRQIGAVIVARDGRLMTTGCNEVPRPGGGEYWESDKDDARDWKLGRDMNDLKKRDAIVELLRELDGVLLPEQVLSGVDALYEELAAAGTFDGTRIDSLTEFGRVSHAEMSALIGAAIDTFSIRDMDLYCTTFPCHLCTRLIVAAGIRNVFYIEPYPKSAALELYGKTEIQVNPNMTQEQYYARLNDHNVCDRRTYFLPFHGVAPRRYTELFTNRRQKKADGTVVGFNAATSKPRRTPFFIAIHLAAERYVASSVESRFQTFLINRESV